MGGAFNSICKPPMDLTVPFSINIDSHIAHKLRDLWYPITSENGMMYYKERYQLVMK